MSARFSAPVLTNFAAALLEGVGLEADKSRTVAEVLVEGDLLGHNTHGLALLARYLGELEQDRMAKTGQPRVLADYPAAVTWDGRRLPGPWLAVQALELAANRAKKNGACTVVIRRSHHLACLAAYLRRVTDRGLMAILTCSDPAVTGVAPHGGRQGAYTPNPFAAGWPTDGDPVLVDISMSITTHGLMQRLCTEGRKFPGLWGIDASGVPTDDPARILTDPPGALLPMGGVDHGHKGYGFALLVEALTGGLAGHGRADPAEGWGATVYAQVFEPALFGGREDFLRQVSKLADTCRATPPRPGFERVRVPGEAGLRRRRDQLAGGIELYAGIMDTLAPWSAKLRVAMPVAMAATGG